MQKIIILFTFIMACFLGVCFAEDAAVEFEGRYWITDLNSEARVVESGIGDKFDFKSDLGIKDENLPEGRVCWHIGPKNELRFAYTQAEFEGDQTVSRLIQFEGQTFAIGSRVVSDFKIKYFRFGCIRQLMNFFGSRLKLSSVSEVKLVNADMSLDAPALSIKESKDLWGGLPTGGLAIDFSPVKKITLFAEASGMAAGKLGYFFDAEAGIKIIPVKYCSIIAGYRMISLKAEQSSDFAKIDL